MVRKMAAGRQAWFRNRSLKLRASVMIYKYKRQRETMKITWAFETSKPTPRDTSSNRSHLVTNSSTNCDPGIQIYEPVRAILLENTTACTPALGNRDS